jgi:precorrin-6B methylase 2
MAKIEGQPIEKSSEAKLTPLYARLLIRLVRPFPNFDFFFIKSLRHEAVRRLQLKRGDRVLDGGCGLGGSFLYLVNAVGSSGEVVGIEISPPAADNARRRVQAKGWNNVRVVVGDFRTVALDGKFNGLLLLGAPDGYASPQALDNLLPYLAKDARVVIFGARLSRHRFMKVFNLFFQAVFSRLTFPSTPALDYEPWALLEQRVGRLEIRKYPFGMFVASGPAQSPVSGAVSGRNPKSNY